MIFPRYRGGEFHEHPLCPAVIRDGLTDFLAFFAEYSGLRRAVYRRLASLVAEIGGSKVVELCGGSGFSAFHMSRRLEDLGCGQVAVKVTDIRANANWGGLVAASDGRLSARQVDALTALSEEDGVFVMFAALHHFSPRCISSLAEAAAARGKTALFVDYFSRGRAVDLFPLFTGPLLMLFTAPLVYPFSWRRLFLTWIVPVLPAILFADTALSLMRAYTVSELKEIAQSAELRNAACAEVFEIVSACGVVRMPALLVSPGISGRKGR